MGVGQRAVREALEAVNLVVPGETAFASARKVGPDSLRALDALHLAAALEYGADLEEVVTYDRRLAAGCEAVDVGVHAPGLAPGWWRG